jgi:hypothetical protein
VRHDREAIRAECERAGGGDWQVWQKGTEKYRRQLKDKIAALPVSRTTGDEPLPGRDGSIYQVHSSAALAHLLDPDHWNAFREANDVPIAARWLSRRGIDLMFVSAPIMPAVYVEQFVDNPPPDGISAPHVRRTFLEMLGADVEVVDAYRLLREARSGEFLYFPVDNHWNHVGAGVASREVARRLGRYAFGRAAKAAPPAARVRTVPYNHPARGPEPWRPFTSSTVQWAELAKSLPATIDEVTMPDGSMLLEDPRSPVVLIGNSFTELFAYAIVRDANLRCRSRWANGNTTEAFIGFLREPEVLDGVRVVIWVTADVHLDHFLRLPEPLRQEVRQEVR